LAGIIICIGIFIVCLAVPKVISLEFLRNVLPSSVILFVVIFSTVFTNSNLNDGNLWDNEKEFISHLQSEEVQELRRLMSGGNEKGMEFRVAYIGYGAAKNLHTLNRLESFNYYIGIGMSAAQLSVVENVFGMTCGPATCSSKLDNSLLFKLTSTKYLVTKSSMRTDPRLTQFKKVYEGSDFDIYENPSAHERFWFPENYGVIPNLEQAIDYMSNQQEDWFNSNVIINRELHLEELANYDVPDSKVVTYEPGNVEMVVDSKDERLMVINNAFDKGWRLKVNDIRQPIYRVNGYFQGIKILKGKNIYRLYYLPPQIEWYLGLSLLTIFSIILVLYRFRRNEHKTREQYVPGS